MTALWSSFLVVALAEMGDKTQLMALALAARYRRPWTVMLGILIATICNHGLAATVGVWVARVLPPATLAWTLAAGFVAFGIWTLVPDEAPEPWAGATWGPLFTTAVVFFLAEMGDKTQLATVALGARFDSAIAVTTGTTLGMLVADGLVVLAGARLTRLVPMRQLRWFAAGLFLFFGLVAAIGAMTGH